MAQEARDVARAAGSHINSHEELCAQRWLDAKESMIRVEAAILRLTAGIAELWKIGLAGSGAIILGMAGLVVTLALLLRHP